MASPSPKSPEQSEKNKQYDRQLRLWGDHGQLALESSHICLINASALGTEILKSIVLPGVGAITIVDDATVSEEDIGCNFFLECSSKGLNRGSEALRLLLELNSSVQGHAVQEPPDQILTDNPEFFKAFSVVIGTGLGEKTIQSLAQHLWDINIPFILCRSVGFLGSFRIQVKEHAVVESHPDNEQPDLRLDVPFHALSEYLNSFDIETVDLKDHGHIPWIVILYKAIQKWQIRNPNSWPMSRKEKAEIKTLIEEFIRKDENGVPINEENFEEALKAVNTALVPTFLPVKIQELLYSSAATNLTKESAPFWIMCSALRSFIEAEGKGKLPVRGVLPDMTASTEHYIKLQNIYRVQAAMDAEVVYRKVQQIVSQLHCDSISESEVKLFCRHANDLHLIKGSNIATEYQLTGSVPTYIARYLEEPDVMMVHYVLLRAAEIFISEHCRSPGDWESEADIGKLKSCVSKLLSDISCNPFPKDDHIHEMCRYGGAEIHSVSAFLGGCVAHEAIKLVTRQYKPVNNTFIYDGASTNTATFTF
ncbi:NEDD8-activating enzyme E1 regulatory subunit-like [Plodia interpunctella]|uniref:NEDD8-activating enzyme E1 regulatory subunit-like n=1 Tax=Plodia interpunctella TaxID=58824 RepID=UPI002368C46F|nr:NEDD8-activating enzyme E1 regulatory subunit-like [Plodia interpunctella]